MKKTTAAILIAVMLTSMAGCQRDDKTNPEQSSSYEVPSGGGEVPFPPDGSPEIHPMLIAADAISDFMHEHVKNF